MTFVFSACYSFRWTFTLIVCVIIFNLWRLYLDYKNVENIKNIKKESVAICVVLKLTELSELYDFQEWVEYHQLLGITLMYIYDNNSTIDLKIIINDNLIKYHKMEGNRMQSKSYDMCLKSYGALHSWLVLIDLDEFIVLKSKKNLIEYLHDFTNYGALALFEKFYSSSNHSIRPAGGVLANYNECKSTDYMKSIINTRGVRANDIHSPSQFVSGFYLVNSEKRRACDKNRIRMKCLMTFQDIWINHYSVKSTEEFRAKKMKGGGNGKFRDDSFYRWANEHTYDCGTIHIGAGNISHRYPSSDTDTDMVADIPPKFCLRHDYRKASSAEFIWSFISKKKIVFEIGSNILNNHLDYYVCAHYNQGKSKNYYFFTKDRYYGRQVRLYESSLCFNYFEFVAIAESMPRHNIMSLMRSYTDLQAIDVVIVGSDFRIYPILLLLREGYANYVLLVGWYSDYYHILLEFMTVVDCLDDVIILQKKDSINYQLLLSAIPKYDHNISDFKWMSRINY